MDSVLHRISHRKTKKGFTYTASFLRSDGTYTSYLSLGTTCKKTVNQIAVRWVRDNPFIVTSNVTLAEFAKGFFAWDGEWARDKRARGLRTSESHCNRQTVNLRLHVLPVLGSKKLRDISKVVIDRFRTVLYEKGLAAGTINHVLGSLNAILDFANDQGIIATVPKVRRVSSRPQEKGILSIAEVSQLRELDWPDLRSRVATLIGHFCGYRQGEILGIRLCDLSPTHIGSVRFFL